MHGTGLRTEIKLKSLLRRKRDCSGRLLLGRLPMFMDIGGNRFYVIRVDDNCNGDVHQSWDLWYVRNAQWSRVVHVGEISVSVGVRAFCR